MSLLLQYCSCSAFVASLCGCEYCVWLHAADLSAVALSLLQEVAWGHHRALADAPTFDDMVEAVESGNISVIGLSETLKKHAFVLNDDWQLHRR